jgi:hypothetical protein
VLSWKLRPEVALKDVTLETLSQDVVIGLMGVSLMNAKPAASGAGHAQSTGGTPTNGGVAAK